MAAAPTPSVNSFHIRPLERLRLERLVEHLHRLGPRAVLELLLALTACVGGVAAMFELLEDCRRLNPRTLRAAGGDRIPPRPLALVPTSADDGQRRYGGIGQ